VIFNFLEQIGALPGDHVFEPGRICIFRERRPGGCRNGRQCGQGDRPKEELPSRRFAHHGHEVGHQLRALVGDLNPGEHMLLAGASAQVFARGPGERAGDLADQIECPGPILSQVKPCSLRFLSRSP